VPRYRQRLPQLDGAIYLMDGGLETWLIFLESTDLRCFAAFPLVADEAGREQLRRYYAPYLRTARERGVGFILDTPTWRANADWGERLGYLTVALADINRRAVALIAELRDAFDSERTHVVIDGLLGPRGDGYRADARMDEAEAEDYHRVQIETFRDTEVDMVGAATITYASEATGIVRAAKACALPVAISFTVETDGRLPSGETLAEAIAQVDGATGGGPAYYMVNCAHATHLGDLPTTNATWRDRVRGLRANGSALSHAELDAATELDAGDPKEFGQHYRALRTRMPRLSVLGGCCGTDHRHIVAICEACLPR
jgi:homocysteine S-methyltransferase